MESIVDDIITGTCCELCNQAFENPKAPNTVYEHGHPVVCHDCWNGLSTRDQIDYIRAKAETYGTT